MTTPSLDPSSHLDRREVVERALATIERLQRRLAEAEQARAEPIAVIGLGCRFPGADGPAAYWELLRAGRDAVREVPRDRFDVDDYYDPDPAAPGKTVVRTGGFLDRVDGFDPHFFGIAPREAVRMDPQHRLFLEVAWEALEHAGQAPSRLRGTRTGVFVGITMSEYLQLETQALALEELDAYVTPGVVPNVAAGRVSHLLGLHGPSLAVDTACSSSLVATHLAVRSLRAGESDVALAGGVNVMLLPETFVSFSKLGMLSASGRCRTFDAAADGFVRGEGCGAVVLKRLSDAVAAGDRVLAVVRGSAVNQDGPSSGLSVPNGLAQQAVIRAALADARAEPEEVAYLEAHGTGTALGDPIEAEAAGLALRPRGGEPLLIGSVKTNLGHLESASGVAGLIKAVLAVHHGEIPPHLHFETPSEHIDWDARSLSVPVGRTPFPAGRPRLAAVSSFGYSGTNANVLVAEPPEPAAVAGPPAGPHLLPLSAKRPEALLDLARRYERRLADPGLPLADACHTAAAGRSHFPHRLAVVAVDAGGARAALAAFCRGEDAPGLEHGTASVGARPQVRFLLGDVPGEGGWLEAHEATFEEALARCRAAVQDPGAEPPAAVRLLARQVALVELWRSYGIEPAAIGGDAGSPGARWAAGGLTLEQAVAVATDPRAESAAQDPRLPLDGSAAEGELAVEISPAGGSWPALAAQLARLYAAGADIDWQAVAKAGPGRLVDLPTYPFQRERYWVPGAGPRRPPARAVHPLLGTPLSSPAIEGAVFESLLSPDAPAFLGDHRVRGDCVLPATAYVEAALAAAAELGGAGTHVLEDLSLHEALVLPDGERRRVQVVATPLDGGDLRFRLYSAGSDGAWTLHGEGRLRAGPEPAGAPLPGAARAACPRELDPAGFYAGLAERGLGFGPGFRGIAGLWAGDGEALGEVELPAPLASEAASYRIHPALLDACWQVFGAAWPGGTLGPDELVMPVAVDRVCVRRPAGSRLVAHARLRPAASAATLTGDVTLWDPDGELVAEVSGLRLRKLAVAPAAAAASGAWREWLYEVAWEPVAALPGVPDAAGACEQAAAAGRRATGGSKPVPGALERLERSAGAYAARALAELGLALEPGQRATAVEIAEGLRVQPRHRGLLERMLTMLVEDGLLRRAGAALELARPLAAEDPGPSLEALAEAAPGHAPEARLLARCGTGLAGVLRGADPLELLFPGGSLEEARSLYRDSLTAQAPNAAAAAAAAAVAAARRGGPLRVLEIGAGTGGTTAGLIAALPAGVEYAFTDVSPRFVAHAREHLTGPTSFELLDVERDPAEQGFAGRRFDLVVAANVLHATADLRQTLANVRALLAPGGVCLLLEGMRGRRWIDLTFGLTEGWWRFADGLRAGSPLLPPEGWEALLAAEGFAGVRAVTPPEPELVPFPQALVAAAAPAAAGTLAVVAPEGDVLAAALVERAGRSGIPAAVVPPDAAAVTQLLERGGGPRAAVVHLASQDPSVLAEASADEVEREAERICADGLAAIQGAAAAPRGVSRLVLVTRGAQAVSAAEAGGSSPVQAALWGLARVAALEHPELRCLAVDLDPERPVDEAALDLLLAEVLGGDAEGEVAHRRGSRHGARLARCRVPEVEAPPAPQRLVATGAGSLDGLELEPAERRAPGPGEIEIAVRATALNFRDVLTVLDMYPGEQPPLGGECAGEVVAVGPGVEGFAAGDLVAAIATGAFASFVTTPAELAIPKPERLSLAEAATVPAAFVTAAYALEQVARVRPGDRVLVHAAAGGVGLAAVQLARRAGAEVLATAGSPEKRALLERMGIEHVMSSRSADFADQAIEATDGRGVDVVLNSLAGDLLEASVRALAEDGRFVELGKRGVWAPDRFAAAKPRAAYAVLDVAALATADPPLVGSILRGVAARVAAGELDPLPLATYPLRAAGEAFRTMAQARHVGKLVVLYERPAVRPDRTYLVTGGLAGLGLATAERLVERGARHVLLVARSEPGPEALAAIGRMREEGARVRTSVADASRHADLARALEEAAMPPLAGVIHSAGVLDDGALVRQTPERFARVLAPKVAGAAALERLTAGLDLDVFCLYSSASALLGSKGQGNHAAANAVLDAVARRRRARGLAALSIGWGAWAELGAAAGEDLGARLAARGIGRIPPREGLQALDRLLDAGASSAAPAHVGVVPLRVAEHVAGLPAAGRFFARLQEAPPTAPAPATAAAGARGPAAGVPTGAPSALRAELDAVPAGRRRTYLAAHVRARALRVLGLDAGLAVDPGQPLNELGLDSLLAVELRNVLGADLDLERPLPATLVFDYPTIEAIVDYLAREVLGWEPQAAADGHGDPLAAELDELSEAEAEAVLLEELGALERRAGKGSA